MQTKHLKQHSLRQTVFITSWFIKEHTDLMRGLITVLLTDITRTLMKIRDREVARLNYDERR
jgi:hypothetical protein